MMGIPRSRSGGAVVEMGTEVIARTNTLTLVTGRVGFRSVFSNNVHYSSKLSTYVFVSTTSSYTEKRQRSGPTARSGPIRIGASSIPHTQYRCSRELPTSDLQQLTFAPSAISCRGRILLIRLLRIDVAIFVV
jgi:hypothetical protein